MKYSYKILLLTIIDVVLIGLWVYKLDPDPSVSLGIILVVPFVFIINLVIAGFLFLLKKENALLFITNAFISSFLMYFLFNAGIAIHQNQLYETWEFQKSDTTFQIDIMKSDSSFYISYSLNSSSSNGYSEGKCYRTDNALILSVDTTQTWRLYSDTTKMKIVGNRLFGFREATPIEMKRTNFLSLKNLL